MTVPSPAVLLVTLDNTASVMSTLDLCCRVCLEPLAELASLRAYEQRQELRQTIAEHRDALRAQRPQLRALRDAQGAHEAALLELKRRVASEEARLQSVHGQLSAQVRQRAARLHEVESLRKTLALAEVAAQIPPDA